MQLSKSLTVVPGVVKNKCFMMPVEGKRFKKLERHFGNEFLKNTLDCENL